MGHEVVLWLNVVLPSCMRVGSTLDLKSICLRPKPPDCSCPQECLPSTAAHPLYNEPFSAANMTVNWLYALPAMSFTTSIMATCSGCAPLPTVGVPYSQATRWDVDFAANVYHRVTSASFDQKLIDARVPGPMVQRCRRAPLRVRLPVGGDPALSPLMLTKC